MECLNCNREFTDSRHLNVMDWECGCEEPDLQYQGTIGLCINGCELPQLLNHDFCNDCNNSYLDETEGK